MDSFSEIILLNNISTEVRNMSYSRTSTNSVRRSTLRKWFRACKATTKKLILKTFNSQCRTAQTSFLQIRASSPNTQLNSTTETNNVSLNNNTQQTHCDQYPEDGRQINPSKMFASLDINLLALARENSKSESVKVYRGHVKEKVQFFEKQVLALNEQDSLKDAKNEKLVFQKESLQDKVRFFEEFSSKANIPCTTERPKTTCKISEKSKEDLKVKEFESESKCSSVHARTPVIHFQELIERDRTIWLLIKELHKQCYFMKQATNIIEACQKVKSFEYDKVHLEAEKLLLLSGLRRDMLLKRIRKLQFPDEIGVCSKKGIIRIDISNLRFFVPKEQKNKKSSFIVVCSTETDMHVAHVTKTKPQTGLICLPGVHSFEELRQDSTMTIKVYQLNLGNCLGRQHMFQFIKNEKNTKFRRRLSVQYKNNDLGTLVQDKVLESLYNVYSSLEIDFSDCNNIRTNYSEKCFLQGLLTLEQIEGLTTFKF